MRRRSGTVIALTLRRAPRIADPQTANGPPPGSPARAPEAPPVSDAHHAAGGGFQDPWPPHPDGDRRAGAFLRWTWERVRGELPASPRPEDLPRSSPELARPRAAPGEIRVTWVGHATCLLQVEGLNLLTDPVWSSRVTPVPGLGPVRFTPPGMPLEDLPPLDAVLLSHDHFDHLDSPTVGMLVERSGPELPWLVPLGHRGWLRRRGVERVVELDWWEEVRWTGDDARDAGPGHGSGSGSDGEDDAPAGARVVALPARHWTRRGLRSNRRLWASWAVLPVGGAGPGAPTGPDAPGGAAEPAGAGGSMAGPDAGAAGRIPHTPRGVYFGADSGYARHFREIGERLGPFRLSLLPIGAYAPRWFMAPSHVDPEEAVQAYLDLGGTGAMVPIHWGTFRLSDEHPLEPPERLQAAWEVQGLDVRDLHLPGIGGTVVLPPPGSVGPGST